VFSRAASFDIVVTMTITVALSLFLASEIEPGKRWWLLAGFYGFVGLSLLAKGLIGIVIPFGVIGVFFVMRRRWPDRTLILSLTWGVPLTLAVAALWYGPVIARHGWPFIDQFFIQHHFARYLSNKYQHPQPVYYYLPVMLILALPWTPFLIASLIKARRWQWRDDDVAQQSRLFALAWFVVPIVFFSFSGSKLPAYILPSLPAAALLVGERLSVYISDKTANGVTMRLTAAMLLLFAVAGVIYAQQTDKVSLRCALLIAAPLVLVGAFALISTRKHRLTPILIAFLPAVGIVLAFGCAVDTFAHRESVRELIQLADTRGYASAPVFMFSRIERTSEFYAAGRLVYGADGEPIRLDSGREVVRQARQVKGPFLIIVPLGSMSQLNNLQGVETNVIDNNGRIAIVAVSAR
jgi:4-amino-4-deoxy-L-arabinose transferase-like glycosyltransferase